MWKHKRLDRGGVLSPWILPKAKINMDWSFSLPASTCWLGGWGRQPSGVSSFLNREEEKRTKGSVPSWRGKDRHTSVGGGILVSFHEQAFITKHFRSLLRAMRGSQEQTKQLKQFSDFPAMVRWPLMPLCRIQGWEDTRGTYSVLSFPRLQFSQNQSRPAKWKMMWLSRVSVVFYVVAHT